MPFEACSFTGFFSTDLAILAAIVLAMGIFWSELMSVLAVSFSPANPYIMFLEVISRPYHRTFSAFSLTSPVIDILLGKFMAAVAVRSPLILIFNAPLPGAILHVDRVIADEKMRWVKARRIIATMTYKHLTIDWERHEEMRCDSMNESLPTRKMPHSIARLISWASKIPASLIRDSEMQVYGFFHGGAFCHQPL